MCLYGRHRETPQGAPIRPHRLDDLRCADQRQTTDTTRIGLSRAFSASPCWRLRCTCFISNSLNGTDESGKPVQFFEARQPASDDSHRRSHRQLKAQLLDRVISAQEEERRRIARELHDEIGQSLTALLVGLQAADLNGGRPTDVPELCTIAAQALKEVQRLALGLRPSVLDDLGLEAALMRCADDFSRLQDTEIAVQTVGLDGERLPSAVETTLYRIAQEALTNVARHARARTVTVVLLRTPASIQLLVEDDGSGFDVTSVLSQGTGPHLGLHGMRERVALVGGDILIESTPGSGATISVQLPIGQSDSGDPVSRSLAPPQALTKRPPFKS